MDAYSLMRTLGALAVVLGLLAGALWIVRRYDIRLPGRISSGGGRRIEVVERTTLDGRRSVALLRRDGREHLILLAPEGNVMLETGIIRDDIDHAAEAARLEAEREAAEAAKAEAEALRESFTAMVEKARESVKSTIKAAEPMLEQVKSRLPAQIGPVQIGAAHAPTPITTTAVTPAAKSADVPATKPTVAQAAKPAAASAKPATKAASPRKGRQTGTTRSRTAGSRRG